ncbi:menaquinol oxidoreductase [Malonomonas rubra]|uniref:menaquinol oxidoreductase n=1 Tax=Malonomonas rubra TaxID=57040 RepID=UPI0026F2499C|nr:menaquinol oxidoreductase [Malonomonas rubra]
MPDIEPLRLQVQAKIRKFELLSSSGLWILALFTAMSIGASRDFDFLPSLSPEIHEMLGSAPPTNFINWALVLYGFSAIIMVLTQMTGGKKPRGAISHFFYLSAFYTFYHFSGDLHENLWAIFTVGMTILSLQGYHVWNYYKDKVREEQEILAELNKLIEEK